MEGDGDSPIFDEATISIRDKGVNIECLSFVLH